MSAGSTAISAPVATASPRIFNPWLVALAVVVPTFMEVLDSSIANVALRYISGGLSAAVTDSEWVITSYLAVNAIISPDLRLASCTSRSPHLLPDIHCDLYHQLRALRHGHKSRA